MQKLKIFIDPLIKERYGPEVCWTWRLLLTSMGYCWEEITETGSDCDVAYATNREEIGKYKVFVQVDRSLWDKRSNVRLQQIEKTDSMSYPLFQGINGCSPAFYVQDGCLICNRDIIFDVFWLATGQEERHWPKDKHGFFELSTTAFFKKQVLRLALASGIGTWLEKRLLGLGFPSPFPRWPNKKQAAACLSHDVDYPEVKRLFEPMRIIGRQGLSGLRAALSVMVGEKTYWHFSSWVELEKKLNLRSAFYFASVQGAIFKFAFGIPDPFYDVKSEQFRKLFKYLTDAGFEIGLHSSYLAFESGEKFANEKQILQQSTGQEIWGNRHHYWHLNPDDIESTLMLHEQIGFKYDSSLTHERYVGWRRGLTWPFFPFHQAERRQLKTLQISPTWMDDQLFGHLDHNPGDRLETLRGLIDTTAEHGGCLVINVHDYVFDDVLFPGWRKTYLWLIENLLDRSDFWIGTPGEIADHWIKRYNSLVQESHGLEEGI